jgi:hypothetical protein
MTKGIPRKQRLAEQRHAKRVQGCATGGSAAKKPPRAVSHSHEALSAVCGPHSARDA